MRVLIAVTLLAACGGPARAPDPPGNRGGTASDITPADDLGDLEIESYVPGGMIKVSRGPDGSIRVLEPLHGAVYIDGMLVGHVPVVVPPLPPGRHHLRIEVAGY